MNLKHIAFIGIAVFFISCKEHKTEEKTEPTNFCLSDTAKKMIEIDSARTSAMEDEIQLSGEVSFDENKVIKVYPRSSGHVIDCKVTLGDKVETGQILAVVRSADIAGNYSDLTSANADVAIAKRQMDNTESLYKNGIASEKEVNEAKQNYEKSLAAKRKIESQLSINGGANTSSGGTYNIVSPISGYIVEKKVNAGNYLRSDMGDYLFTISDLKDVWVMANVFEADIPKVKEGYNVKVTTLAYPDKVLNGKIEKISEVLDPTNKVMKVRIRLNNENMLLKPEMFTKVIVTNTENSSAVCIPQKALIDQNGKVFVVVYHNDCNMEIAEVTPIKNTGDKTYISNGLKAGDKIIVHNQLILFQKLLNN